MSKNIEDIVTVLNICLSSVEKRRLIAENESIKSYLDGYRDACKMILSDIEKRENEEGI